jgi:hypothetical protein
MHLLFFPPTELLICRQERSAARECHLRMWKVLAAKRIRAVTFASVRTSSSLALEVSGPSSRGPTASAVWQLAPSMRRAEKSSQTALRWWSTQRTDKKLVNLVISDWNDHVLVAVILLTMQCISFAFWPLELSKWYLKSPFILLSKWTRPSL